MNDEILKILLRDQTTLRNIIWATSDRSTQEITLDDVENIIPRWQKNRAEQKLRTRARAEIFTPPKVCEIQNNLVIGDTRDLEKFIEAKFLEITCGEAPYITSRYNAFDGEAIDFKKRVGILDRKLHAVSDAGYAFAYQVDLAIAALKSVYGYEFQGDNLFLARKNIFLTLEEFLSDKLAAKEFKELLPTVAMIISCNLWQMDGLKCTIPYADSNRQSEFDFSGKRIKPQGEIFCKILNWRTHELVTFEDLVKGARK